MFDSFNRKINYLRVSVTDRCNLRCRYCMDVAGIHQIPHEEILSFEEIVDVIRVGVRMGVDKIRLTGGEPLVRTGIVTLVKMISQIPGIADFSMTTNGVLLNRFAEPLRNAGLQRLNISIDTIDPERYRILTRLGCLEEVLSGIEAARRAGFEQIKLNTVIDRSPAEQDAQGVFRFGQKEGLSVRFIRKMDLAKGEFWQVEGGEGGNCLKCNRLRLTSNGMVRPCLFNDMEFNSRKLGAREALMRACQYKPKRGHINQTKTFYGLGG